jgi:hypothetical protein
VVRALLGVAMYFEVGWATMVLFIIILVDVFATAFKFSSKSKKTGASRKGLIAPAAITAIVLAAVGVMFFYGEREPVVSIWDDRIQIKAMYGLDMNVSGIEDISLIDQSMDEIAQEMHRDNGYGGFGGTLKGHFSAQNLGRFTLFVKLDSSPTIWIDRREGEDIYISLSDGEKTEILYQELEAAVRLS